MLYVNYTSVKLVYVCGVRDCTGEAERSVCLQIDFGDYIQILVSYERCDLISHIRTKSHIENIKIYLFPLSKLICIPRNYHCLC